ncbi:MAG: cell division protein SepF [Lactobacillaceae bacterium]|jgi:cell division inhibitor SepF|nr:cell division protein SepF [Lactobacillaceae bacterium]
MGFKDSSIYKLMTGDDGGFDDEYYEEDEQVDQPAQNSQQTYQQNDTRPKATSRKNVISMGGHNNSNSKIVLLEPRIYSDAKQISQEVLDGSAVVVNFDAMDPALAKRVVDFLLGTVYAVEGELQRVADNIFLVTPANFEISGTIASNLNHQFEN